jgi:hypothetical protein
VPKYDQQKVRELAEQLKGTTSLIYDVAPAVLGVRAVGSSLYGELLRVAGVFQCDHCDVWKDKGEMAEVVSPETRGWCEACCRRPASEPAPEPKAG